MEIITFASRSIAKPAKPASPVQRRTELSALTGLRFFAAVYVVFYHFTRNLTAGFPSAAVNIFSVGYIAVGLFFLLSGFVLSYSYLRKSGKVAIDTRSFWIARIARIYPAYLLAFIIAAPFQIAGSIGVNGLHLALRKLTLGGSLVLTLLQSWTPWTVWYWNIPAWSLSVEAFFYVCFPFLAPLVGRVHLPRHALYVTVVLWLAGLAVPAVYCFLHHTDQHTPLAPGQIALETNPLMRLPEFLVGVSLGWIFVSGFRFTPRAASALSVTALIALLIAAALSSFAPRPLLGNGLLSPILGLLIFTLAHQSGMLARVLGHPLLKLLGDASYAIYILQFPVASVLGLTAQNCTFSRFFVYLAALIGTSILTFLFIEQPMRVQIKRWLDRSRSASRGTSEISVQPQAGAERITA